MAFDNISLIATLDAKPGYKALSLSYALEVNDSPFHQELTIDLVELAKSCQSSGEMDIFTCGCGIPGCAGLFEGIQVEQPVDAVIWNFFEPMSWSNYQDLSDDEWDAMRMPVRLRFDPEQYLQAIGAGIRTVKALAVSAETLVDLPVRDFEVRDLLDLQTEVFSTRLDIPEKHLVTKELVIDAYCDSIKTGGIYFRLEELHLPAEIVEAYREWKTYQIFPQHESDLPAYRDYLQKGRELCRILRKYLRSRTVVKLKFHPPKIYNSVAWEVTEEMR